MEEYAACFLYLNTESTLLVLEEVNGLETDAKNLLVVCFKEGG